MAQTTKLTVRVDSNSLDTVPQTPILRKLTGILPAEASVEEYRAYLARKYG